MLTTAAQFFPTTRDKISVAQAINKPATSQSRWPHPAGMTRIKNVTQEASDKPTSCVSI